MNNLISRIWDCIVIGTQIMHNNDENLKVNVCSSDKERFIKTFKTIYDNVRDNYMKDSDEPLDRHKVAAIIIISIIKCKIVDIDEPLADDKKFLGNYILATNCGFSYMLRELNRKLENLNKPPVTEFFFPKAMACDTEYYRIFYRNLYFSNTNSEWGLNPLDIAERLFLLEYIMITKNKIDPSELNDY